MARAKGDDAENETPVDEVRRVRERRHREAGGDIRKLIEQSRETVRRYKHQLKLKIVSPPPAPKRRKIVGG
jgi:hypothetical protein